MSAKPMPIYHGNNHITMAIMLFGNRRIASQLMTPKVLLVHKRHIGSSWFQSYEEVRDRLNEAIYLVFTRNYHYFILYIKEGWLVMKFTKETEYAIRKFIVEKITSHANDIVAVTMRHFDISRPTATKYLNQVIADGIVSKCNKGRYPQYKLVSKQFVKIYPLKDHLEEDIIWRKDVAPLLNDLRDNVKRALQYCFTEMVNNVIDHSNANSMVIDVECDAVNVTIWVRDDGVGIFRKIQKVLGLDDPRHSILELAKGKFTSDPDHHSGEGIFFASRICEQFVIFSDKLFFSGHHENDWLLEQNAAVSGTAVMMKMTRNSDVSTADVFDQYSDPDRQPSFHKTRIPVKLMEYEGEALLSRSQAKRLITRFDRFVEVVLDFQGVSEIGQAFADEIFRVFRNAHPAVKIVPVNCAPGVRRMIAHASPDDRSKE